MEKIPPKAAPRPILSIKNLHVEIERESGPKRVLHGLSLDVPKGQTVAILGESGSGKTLAASAVLDLVPAVAKITAGSIEFNGTNLLQLKPAELRKIRGNRIGMVFQEPSTSLNPLMSVGKQIGETLRIHRKLNRKISKEQTLALMDLVGIPDPRRRYKNYPHQLSGGVRQRVVIAMALACKPDLLLADEPTSALDATIQAQILDLLSRLIQDLRMSVLLISHDLGVVAALADRVAVLHGGVVVEEGGVREILKNPIHPYTRTLLSLKPSIRSGKPIDGNLPLKTIAPITPESKESCPLYPVCSEAQRKCRIERPTMIRYGRNHSARCFNPARFGNE